MFYTSDSLWKGSEGRNFHIHLGLISPVRVVLHLEEVGLKFGGSFSSGTLSLCFRKPQVCNHV